MKRVIYPLNSKAYKTYKPKTTPKEASLSDKKALENDWKKIIDSGPI